MSRSALAPSRFGGINSFSGVITVNSGTLQTIIPEAFLQGGNFFDVPTGSQLTPSNYLVVNSAATFDMYGMNQFLGAIGGNGSILTGNVPGANLYLTGNGATTSAAFGGVISGSGGLVKINNGQISGANTQVLTGNNTYTGATVIQGTSAVFQNVLQLSFLNAPGTTSNIISSQSALVFNGGTLVVTASSAENSVSNQTFNGTTITAGTVAAIIPQNSTASATLNINLGAINRQPGSVLNLVSQIPALTIVPLIGTVNITTTSTGVISGNNILTDANSTAYATTQSLAFNTVINTFTNTSNDINFWAGVNSSGQIVPATPTFNPTAGMSSSTNAVYTNAALTFAPNSTIGSLNFVVNGTFNFTGTNTVTSGGFAQQRPGQQRHGYPSRRRHPRSCEW